MQDPGVSSWVAGGFEVPFRSSKKQPAPLKPLEVVLLMRSPPDAASLQEVAQRRARGT